MTFFVWLSWHRRNSPHLFSTTTVFNVTKNWPCDTLVRSSWHVTKSSIYSQEKVLHLHEDSANVAQTWTTFGNHHTICTIIIVIVSDFQPQQDSCGSLMMATCVTVHCGDHRSNNNLQNHLHYMESELVRPNELKSQLVEDEDNTRPMWATAEPLKTTVWPYKGP